MNILLIYSNFITGLKLHNVSLNIEVTIIIIIYIIINYYYILFRLKYGL